MTKRDLRALASAGFVIGVACGALMWSHVQRQYRRDLFSRHPLRRFAALTYLHSKPTMSTARLLREYVAWERSPLLRQRGVSVMRRVERKLA